MSGSGLSSSGSSIQGVGGAIQGIGSLYSGYAQADSLNSQAQLQDENAQIAIQGGDYDAAALQRKAGAQIGAMQAQIGGSGLKASSGSFLDLVSQSAVNAELDRQNIIYQSKLKAMSFQNQATLDRASANSAITAGYFGAAAGAVSGLAGFL